MLSLIGLSYAEINFMYNRTGVPLVCAGGAGQDGGLHGRVDGVDYSAQYGNR